MSGANLANFALFQLAWYAAVRGAVSGSTWIGVLAAALFALAHVAWLRADRRELGFALLVALAGALLDSLLCGLGLLGYPTSHAPGSLPLAPPWIAALWFCFALLPRRSLAWLAPRPRLAALLGAVGGPLSYCAGVRIGAVAVPGSAAATYGALALEYALATPLLLRFAPLPLRAAR